MNSRCNAATMATAIRCTLPGCCCECFNPCKTQLRTCQSCQHGWVAHDSLTEEQVSKIRKKGLKHGRSCQHPRCDCNDYKNTSTGIQASWLSKCATCKHSGNDHRIPTSFDKLRAQHAKHAGTSPCVGCALECQGFGKHDDSVPVDSPVSKQCTLCGHSVENHRPKMETDELILSAARENTSVRCQKMLEGKDQTSTGGKCDGYDMHDWFEAVNVDSDERQDTSDAHNCHCRGFVMDDPARFCHTYYGLLKDIVLPHLSSVNCQRCSHNLSDHRKLSEEEQKEREIQNESKLTLLTMSQMQISTKDGQHPVAMYTPDDKGPQVFGLARILKGGSNKTASLRIGVIPIGVPHSKVGLQIVKETKRKRTNSGKILNTVKNKLKKRKLMSSAGDNDSDELRSDESGTCSESDSYSTKFKKKFKKESEELNDNQPGSKNTPTKHLTNRHSGETVKDGKPVGTPGELASTVANALMDCMQEMVIELPKQDVKALAWGRLEGDTDLLLAVGFQDSSLMIYKVAVGMVTEMEKCNYDGMTPVSRLLWIPQGEALVLVVGSTDGRVNLIKVTKDGSMKVGFLENNKRSSVTALTASSSGSCVCVGQQDGSVSFYMINSDNSMPKLLSTSSIAYGGVQSLAWHPSKNIVVAAGEDDHVTVFYMETLADRKKDKTRGTIMHYLGRKRRFELDIFNKCCKLKGHMSFVAAVTFDPSGSFLISAGWDGQILFWNTTDIDDVISCGAGDVSTIECSTGFMIGQKKFHNFPTDGINFMPLVLSLAQPVVYVLTHTDSETLCLVAYQVPKKYR